MGQASLASVERPAPPARLDLHPPRRHDFAGILLLLVLTEAVYLRPSILRGKKVLLGLDYLQLHIRGIEFARNALLSAHMLPGWNPRILLGMPFAANIQSFPWIPTRLVLFLFNPDFAFAVGVALAAALAALFTYLFCRRAGLSVVGAATAGWTFACAGYFTSRVAGGHLVLLEAYPALPLLLWLIERARSPERAGRRAWDLGALAFCAASIALAGHPQIPAYALGTALLYIGVRGRGVLRAQMLAAIAFGVGATMAVWWPTLSLIGRSTRLLALAPPDNDVYLPYGRLLAFLAPGRDGYPPGTALFSQQPFHGYPNAAYFWDTASYVGLLPLLAAAVLLVWFFLNRRLPAWPWTFLAAVGVAALLYALPLSEPLRRSIPGTFLRAPARLLYITTFSLAAIFGAGLDAFLKSNFLRIGPRRVGVGLCLAIHFLDLAAFSVLFIEPIPPPQRGIPQFETLLAREAGNARIATDAGGDGMPLATKYDDAGGFDSILLADSYRAFLALTHAPADLNAQRFDGAALPIPALRAMGVRFVITRMQRGDLETAANANGMLVYRVPNPAPRAAYFTGDATEFLPAAQILKAFVERLRFDRLLLPEEARGYLPAASVPSGKSPAIPTACAYDRPSSDEIRLTTASSAPGFAEVLEAYDPGWVADVDGTPAAVLVANGFSMAVPVAAGSHIISLRYHTPGLLFGGMLSFLSLGGLAVLMWRVRATAG